MMSTDGRAWEEISDAPVEPLLDIVYGSGTFLALGASGSAYASVEGRAWTAQSTQFGGLAAGIARGNGRFVIFGERASVAVSTDSQLWETNPVTSADSVMRALDYLKGRFAGVVEHADAGDGQTGEKSYGIVTSPAGKDWVHTPVELAYPLTAIGYCHGVYLALSAKAVWTSAAGYDWTEQSHAPDHVFGLGCGGDVSSGETSVVTGRNVLLASSDGRNWDVAFEHIP
jgi:hypothetical protein